MAHNAVPRPVAATRPLEPFSSRGLPVTQPGEYPWYFENWSMIQAIVWPSVLTSGSRDVDAWTDDDFDAIRKASCQSLELSATQGVGIDLDTPLRASVGDSHDSGLPRHQAREGIDFVLIDFGVIAEAPLVGPSGGVVLNAESLEDLDRAVVHLDRDFDFELSLWGHQELLDAASHIHGSGGISEVAKRVFE